MTSSLTSWCSFLLRVIAFGHGCAGRGCQVVRCARWIWSLCGTGCSAHPLDELPRATDDAGPREEDHQDEDQAEDRRPPLDRVGEHVLDEHDHSSTDDGAKHRADPTKDDHDDEQDGAVDSR